MKRILITGTSGYIGTKFDEYVKKNKLEIDIDFISLRSESWKQVDFGNYDSVLHLAGIAHVSRNPKFKDNYMKINRDLTLEIAKKAKEEGVSQFIFMSSIIVYGSKNINRGQITHNTIPKPIDFYGGSKLEAESLLKSIESDDFQIGIIRTPMVYGENSKGNYTKLSKFSKLTPIIPYVKTTKSMIYIDNLSSVIANIIVNNMQGTFYPQNQEYINTSEMMIKIAEFYGRHPIRIKGFGNAIKYFSKHITILDKVFGDLYYEKTMSNELFRYQVVNFNESINKTENIKGDGKE